MGGKLEMMKSINLANQLPYDALDLWVLGVDIWMEMDPTKKTNVYLIIPNLVVTDKDKCTSYFGKIYWQVSLAGYG